MASIKEYRSRKTGKILSFNIKVFSGTTKSTDGDGERQVKKEYYSESISVSDYGSVKEARRAAIQRSAELDRIYSPETRSRNDGTSANPTFRASCERYIALKAQKLAPSTIEGYHDLTQRIYPLIGELRIREITSTDMEDLYSALRKEHKKTSVAVGCDNLADVIREKKFGKTASLSLKSLTKDKSRIPNSVLARIAKVSPSVIASALNNNPISEISAEKISTALGYQTTKLFNIQQEETLLSEKTVLEYHQLISAVFNHLKKSGKILINPSEAATNRPKPKNIDKPSVNYHDPETIQMILREADTLDIKHRALLYALIFTGARRGAVCGIEWSSLDLNNCTVAIQKTVNYSKKKGIYIRSAPKNAKKRTLKMAAPFVAVMVEYKEWFENYRLQMGSAWIGDNDFVFTADDGTPLNPDTLSSWLSRYYHSHSNMPKLNAHSFRHSLATYLINQGTAIYDIAEILGDNPETVQKVYVHEIQLAQARRDKIMEGIYG